MRIALSVAISIVLASCLVGQGEGCAGYDCPSAVTFSEYWFVAETVTDFCDYSSTDTSRESCQAGFYYDNTSAQSCCDGYWCPRGFSCAKECLDGHYCTGGDFAYCTEGYYCPTASTQVICPTGSFCPTGSHQPIDCTPMNTCTAEGLAKAYCFDYVFWLSMVPLTATIAVILAFRCRGRMVRCCKGLCSCCRRRKRAKDDAGDKAKNTAKTSISSSAAGDLISSSPSMNAKVVNTRAVPLTSESKSSSVPTVLEKLPLEGLPAPRMNRRRSSLPGLNRIKKNLEELTTPKEDIGEDPLESKPKLVSNKSSEAAQSSNRETFSTLMKDPDFMKAFGQRGAGVVWRALAVRFGKKTVLNEVNGELRPGNLTALMGPSGAGKTTLLRALANLQRPASGSIDITGADAKDLGFVHQFNSHYGNLTVRESLTMLFLMKEWRSALRWLMQFSKMQHRLKNLCRMFGIDHVMDSRVGTAAKPVLSGGEAKRLAVARELLKEPGVILLDEPTSGLDDTTSLSLLSFLRALAVSGKTIVLTIHQPRLAAFEMISHLYILAVVGRVFFEGPRRHLIPYLDVLGFKIQQNMNPADYVMDVVSGRVARTGGRFELSSDPAHLCDIWDEVKDTVATVTGSKLKAEIFNRVRALDEKHFRRRKEEEIALNIAADTKNQKPSMVTLMRMEIQRLDDAQVMSSLATKGRLSTSNWAGIASLMHQKLLFTRDESRDNLVKMASSRRVIFEKGKKSASFTLSSCTMQKFFTHSAIMIWVSLTLCWRDKVIFLAEVLGGLLMGLVVGVVFTGILYSNVLIATTAAIIPLCLLGIVTTIRQLTMDYEVGMREYLMDFGTAPAAYVLAKQVSITLVQIVSVINFCVWSDFFFQQTAAANIWLYMVACIMFVSLVGGVSTAVSISLSQRSTLITLICVLVGMFVFSGGIPTITVWQSISPATVALYSINPARWFNHVLFLNRMGWWLGMNGWKDGVLLEWTNLTHFYPNQEGMAWGLFVAMWVLAVLFPMALLEFKIRKKYLVGCCYAMAHRVAKSRRKRKAVADEGVEMHKLGRVSEASEMSRPAV